MSLIYKKILSTNFSGLEANFDCVLRGDRSSDWHLNARRTGEFYFNLTAWQVAGVELEGVRFVNGEQERATLVGIQQSYLIHVHHVANERTAGHLMRVELDSDLVFAGFARRKCRYESEIALVGERAWYAAVLNRNLKLSGACLGGVHFEQNCTQFKSQFLNLWN